MRIRGIASIALIYLAGAFSFCASFVGLVGLFWGGMPHFFRPGGLGLLPFLGIAIQFPAFLVSVFLLRATSWPMWGAFLLGLGLNLLRLLSYCTPAHCGENTDLGPHRFWMLLAKAIIWVLKFALIPAVVLQVSNFLKIPERLVLPILPMESS